MLIAALAAFSAFCQLAKTIVEKFCTEKNAPTFRRWGKKAMDNSKAWSQRKIIKINREVTLE